MLTHLFMKFNILFIIHYYLFVMCKFFVRENNYLFVLLKYLFQVPETNYIVLKKYFLKYRANIVKCDLDLKISL